MEAPVGSETRIWAFDVDGTLIGSIRSDVLRPGADALLGELVARGVTCVLWSAGGEEYARRMAERHDIARHLSGYYGKNGRDSAKRYTLDHFHPDHVVTTFVDDSPVDLPADAEVVPVSQFLGGSRSDRVLLDLLADLDRHLGDAGDSIRP